MNPTCKQCGAACCKTLLIDPETLPGYLFLTLMYRNGLTPVNKQIAIIDNRCKHLNAANLCDKYECRPAMCSDYEVDGQWCRLTREATKRL